MGKRGLAALCVGMAAGTAAFFGYHILTNDDGEGEGKREGGWIKGSKGDKAAWKVEWEDEWDEFLNLPWDEKKEKVEQKRKKAEEWMDKKFNEKMDMIDEEFDKEYDNLDKKREDWDGKKEEMENNWNEKKDWMNEKFDEKMDWLEEKHDRMENGKPKEKSEEDMKKSISKEDYEAEMEALRIEHMAIAEDLYAYTGTESTLLVGEEGSFMKVDSNSTTGYLWLVDTSDCPDGVKVLANELPRTANEDDIELAGTPS